LAFANAGHPPLIIIHADCSAEIVNTRGRLISDYIPANCEDIEVQLHDNDIIVLYTDGIIEERSGDELFGEERFIDILKSRCLAPAGELCNSVYNALIEFKGDAMLDDDFTILVMRFRKKR
ncbi:MAG TPA: PP2C family protein-serine/threonine phosphatase, partial [Spirochaetota bacterium]|nr:PP2C family protein-serine/threonine phosphatase [Spirochaetota bacterium]